MMHDIETCTVRCAVTVRYRTFRRCEIRGQRLPVQRIVYNISGLKVSYPVVTR
jgi:hypothetical protein